MPYYSEERRKEKLIHPTTNFVFFSCMDLSGGIKVYYPEGMNTPEIVAQETSQFVGWWMANIYEHLNGWTGFSMFKYEFIQWDFSKKPIT